MFPRLRQTVLARADLLVELATLGEYGLDERGAPMPLDPAATRQPYAAGPPLDAIAAGTPHRAGVAPCTEPARPLGRRRSRCATGAGRCLTAPDGGAAARP